MEKNIKTLPELKSIIDANKFHTFDYTEGFSVSDGIEIFEIDENDDVYQSFTITMTDTTLYINRIFYAL